MAPLPEPVDLPEPEPEPPKAVTVTAPARHEHRALGEYAAPALVWRSQATRERDSRRVEGWIF